MKTVLLTGFDPFDGERVNPSWEAVKRLRGARIAGHTVAVARLPTEFARAPRALFRAMARHQPTLVLCVGQAGGRAAISLERVAVNLCDARIRDNAGAQPVDVPVVEDAPAAYFAPLPVKALAAALRDAGVPTEVSYTAGTFVCNAVLFALCHRLTEQGASTRAGFIHIPYSPQQAAAKPGAPSLALETVERALRICVREALR
ncbi:MAG: pyroglutamyl-peptidase I [Vicinamibacteria bacterium]|jgi:pyroglutamyl-peptidase|nr:pyroglutamyl-peptidase I [Vicinamibacteria bacterium]